MTCPSCEASTDSSQRRCPACGETLPVSPGWVIAERYEIQAALGEGGMGAVFRARDRALHVNVAFKVLRLARDATAVRRFHHEVALARKVKHENVCAVYEYGEDQGVLFCTMELVGGRTLRQVIREEGPLPTDRAYGLALKAAAGLRAIHEAGVLHRDLKASNIMVDGKERVRLVDFGIAKAMPTPEQADPTTDTPITGHEAIVGTPAYMSPEQVMGWPLDARSDIYSFGVVLFELFTGELPFPGSRAAILRKQMEEPAPLHGRLAQSLPSGLVPVLERALAKDPDQRHPDVAALIQDLERTRDSFQTKTMDAVSNALPRRGLLAALAVLAGALLLAMILWARKPPEAVPSPPPPVSNKTLAPNPSPNSSPASISLPSPSLPPAATPAIRKSPSPVRSPTTTTTSTSTTTTSVTTTTTVPRQPVTIAGPPITIATPPPIVEPVCERCPPPSYPAAAAQYGLEGQVRLEITVDAKGNVAATRVLSGHSALRPAAQKAVRSWRFKPATRGGVPIEYTFETTVTFSQSRRP